MDRKPIYGDRWSESSLEHAERVGMDLYLRTLSRQVKWSPVKQSFRPHEEDCPNVSLDEAFTSMMNFLHQASKECKKYHCHREHTKDHRDSKYHCTRFHSLPPKMQPVRNAPKGSLFEREETVHLTLPQGAYSITAHNRGSGVKRTNIVQVADEGRLTLGFNL